MAKKKNRKKEYKLGLKRSGVIKTSVLSSIGQTAVKKSLVQSKVQLSYEEFVAISAMSGIRSNLVEAIYNEGIQSVADFEKFTEEEVLAFKGIGPATVAKLKANGVTFKA